MIVGVVYFVARFTKPQIKITEKIPIPHESRVESSVDIPNPTAIIFPIEPPSDKNFLSLESISVDVLSANRSSSSSVRSL